MEKNKETVEDVKVEGTGEVDTQTTEKNEGQATVEMISKEEAQKMADAIVAKKLAKMPSKEELAKFNEWKESQKTEAEKQAEIQKQLIERETEIINLKNENTLLRKGVNSDDIDYVLFKVGKMEGEFETNLDNFLEEKPKFLGKSEKVTTTGVAVNKGTQKETGVEAILRAKHPELFN